MITKSLRFLIFAWIMLLMSTCEKGNDFPKKYVFDSYNIGVLKAYTKTGEITDTPTINDFIAEKKNFFWQSDLQINNWHFEIEIISDTLAKITDADTSIYYNLIRKNGIVYFQDKNRMWNSDGPLTDERLKYSPLYIRFSPYTNGGYLFIPCYYIIETSGELHMPFASYFEKIYGSTGNLISYQAKGNYNNVFNTTYLSKVQNSGDLIDTIVYQDNTVILKEK
ncbi:MAG TPA: hypothetical protein VIH57_19860 [Bacteroidales bacterium]